ncbi:MAG TPA: ATPase inhibitor subunit zeta [Alphaproteobacteria bacterium]|nr:ATPase inhibitor subunit zeta [Alphaproteobacteria bacterium]
MKHHNQHHHHNHASNHLEKTYAHKEEDSFRTLAKRNKLFGLWIAEQLGMDRSIHDSYANEVIIADLAEPGPMDIIRKVMNDAELRGIYFKEDFLLQRLDYFDSVAHEESEE